MSLFVARFDGHCKGCGEGIEAGDYVGYIEDEVGIRCAGCVDAYDEGWDEIDFYDEEEWDRDDVV